jgi:nitrite reductase/ring-hydroxylating ferredoxin subunit
VVRCGSLVRVYRDCCPHQHVQLPWRRDEYLNRDRTRIVCSAHGAQFTIDTGECVLGACLGDRLQSVPFQIDTAGSVVLVE